MSRRHERQHHGSEKKVTKLALCDGIAIIGMFMYGGVHMLLNRIYIKERVEIVFDLKKESIAALFSTYAMSQVSLVISWRDDRA